MRVPGKLGALWRRTAAGTEPDPGDAEPGWPFDQPPNAAALTVQSVLDGQPILHVAHDADDHGWQFLDGRDVDVDQGRVIGMATALRLDPTLRSIADLPPGWIARRESDSDPWHREPHG